MKDESREKPHVKFEKEKWQKPSCDNFNCLFSFSQPVYRKIFMDEYYPSVYFLGRALRTESVSTRMNTIAWGDQFKPIRMGENSVVSYNVV